MSLIASSLIASDCLIVLIVSPGRKNISVPLFCDIGHNLCLHLTPVGRIALTAKRGKETPDPNALTISSLTPEFARKKDAEPDLV